MKRRRQDAAAPVKTIRPNGTGGFQPPQKHSFPFLLPLLGWPAMKDVLKVFHTMEKVFAIFPHNGKIFFTLWKTSPEGP